MKYDYDFRQIQWFLFKLFSNSHREWKILHVFFFFFVGRISEREIAIVLIYFELIDAIVIIKIEQRNCRC